jgi:outer membrane receptor protein involved in Fe transport
MISYSKRINRPRGWWLEPFITWEDAYNVRQGNPGLLPEYIDSYETGYMKSFNDNFFSLEAYYRVTRNKVERISSVYQENVILRRPYNIGNDYSLGLEAMLSIGITPWWDMEISGNYFRYWMEGEIEYQNGQDFYTETIDRYSRNWNSRFNNTFSLWKNGEFQVSSRYNSESITAQGTTSGYFTLDAAFKVTFLNRSLSANLQGRDLLGTSLRESISEGPDFYSYYQYEPKSPVVVLTLSYKFNNFVASRRSAQNGGEGDDF